MLKIRALINKYEYRIDLYQTLFRLQPRMFTTRVITREIKQDKVTKDLPRLSYDRQKIKSFIQKVMTERYPKLDPILSPHTVYKVVEQPKMVERNQKKDIFIQAQEAFFGHGREKNVKEALEIYQEAERKGIVKASNCLGLMYLKGEGVGQDYEKAFKHFLVSERAPPDQEGREDGFYWMGHMLYNNMVPLNSIEESKRKAIQNFEKAAQLNHSQAMCDLGLIYEHGMVGPVDLNRARTYYEKAVMLNNPMAMDNLGVFLLKEESNLVSNEANNRLAFELFDKARNLGYKKSLTNLGILYLKGIHVQKDLVNAKELFKKAASGDHPDIEAKFYLAYFKLKEASISQDEAKFEEVADELRYVLALDKNHSDANYYLGFLFENGLGTDKDLRSAFKHFKIAMQTDPNNSKAKVKVANFYMTGEGQVYPDKAGALDLYQQAASQGNSDALLALGAFYEMGTLVDKDPERAKALYEQAANKGNPSGFYNLGLINLQDKNQDYKKVSHIVLDYMQKAAHNGNDRAKDFISKFGSSLPTTQRPSPGGFIGQTEVLGKDAIDQNNVNVKYESRFY
jgi:TPR repeat protein